MPFFLPSNRASSPSADALGHCFPSTRQVSFASIVLTILLISAELFSSSPVTAQTIPSFPVDEETQKEAQVFSDRVDNLDSTDFFQFKKDYPIFSALTSKQIDILKTASSDDRKSLFAIMKRKESGQPIDFGQTSPKMVTAATVELKNATIVSQQGNVINISFDLSNKEGIQPGIRFVVRLIRPATKEEASDTTADTQVMPDTIVLGTNSTTHQAFTYTAPEQLSGSYALSVEAWTSGGIILGVQSVGDVTFSGNGQVIEIIPGSCKLSAATWDGQALVIEPTDIPVIRCDLKNPTDRSIALTPSFQTFTNTIFDLPEPVRITRSPMVIGANERKTITLSAAPISTPGIYILRTMFTATGFHVVPIDIPLIVRGESATINNFLLNKSTYRKGEMATLSLIWNSFSGTQSPVIEGATARIGITDDGKICGGKAGVPITQSREEIAVLITRDCLAPNITVEIFNRAGNVLTLATVSFDGSSDTPQTPITTNGAVLAYVLAILLILLIVIIFILLMRRHVRQRRMTQSMPLHDRYHSPKSLLILLLGLGASVIMIGTPVHRAQAETALIPISIAGYPIPLLPAMVTYRLDKPSYAVGETVTASALACVLGICGAEYGRLFAPIGAGIVYDAEMPGMAPPEDFSGATDHSLAFTTWLDRFKPAWTGETFTFSARTPGIQHIPFYFNTGWFLERGERILSIYMPLVQQLIDPDCVPRYPGDSVATSDACSWFDQIIFSEGLYRRFSSASITAVNSLTICADNCGSGQLLSGTTVTLPIGTAKNAVACYNTLTDCTSINQSDNVTNSAVWSAVPAGIVAMSGDAGARQEIITGQSAGTATVSATYLESTSTFDAQVTDPIGPTGILHVCSSCSPGATLYTINEALSLYENTSKSVHACYSPSPPTSLCSGEDVSDRTDWSSIRPDIATVERSPGGQNSATVTGYIIDETTGTAAYQPPQGNPASAEFGIQVNRICVCDTSEANNYCPNVLYEDNCQQKVCPGAKQCDMEWREVAP